MAKRKVSNPSQLDLLKRILDNDYIDENKVLVETNVDEYKKSFTMRRDIVSYTDLEYILFRYDPDKIEIFPYFSAISGLKKICDYIMFVEEKDHLYVLIIELKKGLESANNQLVASECFVKFIIDSAERIGVKLTSNIHFRKIRISEERANKVKKSLTKPKGLEYDVNKVINYDHKTHFRIKEIVDAG